MARTGMTALLEELRGLAEAGTSEYTIGTTLYWSDNALQDIMDVNRRDVVYAQLAAFPKIATGGTLTYFEYRSAYDFLEQTSGGTDICYLQNGGGTALGTALWSADYRRGVFTFAGDTAGSTVYMTGRSYDLNAAAADIWRRKASHYAPTSFNFSTDNHSVSREQVYTHCIDMATYFQGISGNAIQTIGRYRSDMQDGYNSYDND
jgi:hypothetical protein